MATEFDGNLSNWRPGRRELLAHFARLGLGAASLSLIAGCPDPQVLHGGAIAVEAPEPQPTSIRLGVNRLSPGEAVDFTAGKYRCYLHRGQGEEWIAVSRRCTHSGCLIAFQRDTQSYECPCHGSAFDAFGKPLRGPAKLPLKRYKTAVDGDAVIVTFEPYVETAAQAPPAAAPAQVPDDRSDRPPLPDFSGETERQQHRPR